MLDTHTSRCYILYSECVNSNVKTATCPATIQLHTFEAQLWSLGSFKALASSQRSASVLNHWYHEEKSQHRDVISRSLSGSIWSPSYAPSTCRAAAPWTWPGSACYRARSRRGWPCCWRSRASIPAATGPQERSRHRTWTPGPWCCTGSMLQWKPGEWHWGSGPLSSPWSDTRSGLCGPAGLLRSELELNSWLWDSWPQSYPSERVECICYCRPCLCPSVDGCVWYTSWTSRLFPFVSSTTLLWWLDRCSCGSSFVVWHLQRWENCYDMNSGRYIWQKCKVNIHFMY